MPHLVNPRNLNDKIRWLELFDQDEEMIRCADKVRMRDYVRERLGPGYTPVLYQVCDRFRDIEFNALPEAFVIKTNHDSGTVFPVRDKKEFRKQDAEEKIEEALKRPFGWRKGEWHYQYIPPKVLVEEFLEHDSPGWLPDYKFYCVEGTVKCCRYISDRGLNMKQQILDRDGNDIWSSQDGQLADRLRKGGFWTAMLDIAERLSKGFRFVRVDMYQYRKRVLVGELTFFPNAGIYVLENQKDIGCIIEFDRSLIKPCILEDLAKKYSPWRYYPDAGRNSLYGF